MFIQNDTASVVALSRGFVSETELAIAIILRTRYAIGPRGLTAVALEQQPDDELPPIFKAPEWRGTSVTVRGTVRGPASSPFQVPVEVHVGTAEARVLVFGERRWTLSLAGTLTPSAPERFDGILLGFDRAFGGSYDVPPGLDADTQLPDPGGRVPFLLNPIGLGFYPTDERAVNQRLPNIEDPENLIRSWDDRPVPVGVSACPEHHALRLLGAPADDEDDRLLHFQHHAPPKLIFAELPTGTPIRVVGVGPRTLVFTTPAIPADVSTLPSPTNATWRVRAVDIDADTGAVDITTSAEFVCVAESIPRWIYVTPGAKAA